MPFFSGLVGGISEGLGRARAEAADHAERQSQLEASILQHLSTSTDPEIASRAIAGLLGQADPSTRKHAKGLRGFLGETEGNPALPMLRDFITKGRTVTTPGVPSVNVSGGLPADTSGSAAPTVAAAPGSAAMPSAPGVHPGISTMAPPPGPATTPGRPTTSIVPRQVFHTPDEQAELTAAAHERGTLNTRITAYRAAQSPGEQSIIPGVNNPPAWIATGTVQGKDLPAGTTDHLGQPTLPGQYYARRVSPQDATQAAYFPVAPPASIANQAAIAARPTFQHMVGPDNKTPGVWRVYRDGSKPPAFIRYSGARDSYLKYTDPETQQEYYIAAPAQFTPMAELTAVASAPGQAAPGATAPTAPMAGAPPGPVARPAAGPPPSPGQAPGASGRPGAAPTGAVRGIPGGRKRDLQSVEGAFLGPDGTPQAGTAFLDKGLGQYFSAQDPTQPAQGFIPGELGTYATTAFHQANATLITIERAIQAIDDAGLAKNTDPATTAALVAKFYGGKLGDNPIQEAAASMTNLAALQGASQYVRSNSRSYQMFQQALMHLPRTPGEQAAQLSQIPGVGGLVNPATVGGTGLGHGWDPPATMRQKLELAKSVIQQGKTGLAELVGKSPDHQVGGPPSPPLGPKGAKNVPRGTSQAGTPVTVTAGDGSVHTFPSQKEADVFKASVLAVGGTVR